MKRIKHTEEVKAMRIFTDREEPRKAFWQQYEAAVADLPNADDDVRVVNYYGVGGIGKTALLKKLMEEMNQNLTTPWYAGYNFESGTDLRNVLKALKATLERKYKFDFILFNLGLYVYAQKCGEEAAAIEKKSLMDAHPLWHQVFNVVDNIPVASVVTKALSTIDGVAAYAATQHVLKKHENRIKRLSFLEPEEVYQELPLLFAEDLTRNTEKAKQPLVIFLDTYELLVNEMAAVGEPLMNDRWLRDPSGPIQSVPHVLWVIAGREKLKWERFDPDWADAIDAHRLGDLSQQDSIAFLQGAGIADDVLAHQLYRLTNGTPVYLDLCVDVYEALQRKGLPMDATQFGGNTIELIERFMRYMDDTQKTLAYIAACMNQWDDEAFSAVAKALSVWNPTTYEKFKCYSFLDAPEEGRYIIHQTVRDVLVANCPSALRQDIATAMVGYFSEYIQEQSVFSAAYPYALTGMVWGGLLLHTDRNALEEFLVSKVEKHMKALFVSGQFKESETILALLWAVAEKEKNDRLYTTILVWKCFCLSATGAYAAALILQQEVLKIRRETLGEDHPNTLAAMGNVASTLGILGRPNEAFVLQKEVLEKRRLVLGEDHPDTLTAMNNLANTLYAFGYYNAAMCLLQETLEQRRHLLDEDHPDTLLTMGNLAVALYTLGRCDEALILQQEVLEKRRHLLGEDHPDTLGAMSDLANTLCDLGRHDEALILQQEVLEKHRHILGEDHPHTLHAINNLAATLNALGRHNEAFVLQQEVLEKRRRILGEDHPHTLHAINNLATTLSELGQHDKASHLQREVFETTRRILGEDHPDTLKAMNNLASALYDLEQYDEALTIQQEALEKHRRILGEDHPDTLTIMNNLAGPLCALGRHDEALILQREVLEKCRHILGEDHPKTLTAMSNLADTLFALGQNNESLTLLQEALEKYRRTLGEKHPNTWTAMQNLASVYLHVGEIRKGMALMAELLKLRGEGGTT